MECCLALFDAHIPYNCKHSYDIALTIAKDLYEDGILKQLIIGGDWADFYALNHFGKDPNIIETFYDEIFEVKKTIKEIRKELPKIRIDYCIGNHEHRLEKFIYNKVPELANILGLPSLFELGEAGIIVHPYEPGQAARVLNTGIICRHEPFSSGIHCAHATVTKASCSVIFGHTHRIQQSHLNSFDGRIMGGYSCGWLGDENHPSGVFNYVKQHHNWQKGLCLITKINNTSFIEIIPILKYGKKYTCKVNGHLYES